MKKEKGKGKKMLYRLVKNYGKEKIIGLLNFTFEL